MTKGPNWFLPGMEKFSEQQLSALKRAIDDTSIVNSIHCLGWSLWPTKNQGYYDSEWLRTVADFLEIQNKPFWDEYEAYCENLPPYDPEKDNNNMEFGEI